MDHKLIWLLLATLCFSACKREGPAQPTPYTLPAPRYFPTALNMPSDNPLTQEGVELGRYLFYDGHFSGRDHPDSLMSCGTCHLQEYGFVSGMDNPYYKDGKMIGLTGKPTPNNMLPLVNLVYCSTGYLWNGKINISNKELGNELYGIPKKEPYHFRNIESLVWMTIAAPHEADGNIDNTVALIASNSMYPPMFEKAFGSPEVNIDRICKAIAQFIRTLISYNSKFDKYMRGEATLTDEEMRGYILFTTEEGADCFHCHGGSGNALFSSYAFENNGLDNYPEGIGRYKVPTLRNIEKTAPYMHDGRFKTLNEVIDHYSEGVKISPTLSPLMHHAKEEGVQLTEKEKIELKAFLYTLTDEEFLRDPRFAKPRNL